MTETSIITIDGTHPAGNVDCLLDTMLTAQNTLGQITWTDINTDHALGTYHRSGATRPVAVLNTTASTDTILKAHHWIATATTNWTTADHDPTSTTSQHTDHTTTATLAAARSDIHAAVDAHDDPYRREQYCRSAIDYAAAVIMAPDATTDQRARAHLYMEEAQGMLTLTQA